VPIESVYHTFFYKEFMQYTYTIPSKGDTI